MRIGQKVAIVMITAASVLAGCGGAEPTADPNADSPSHSTSDEHPSIEDAPPAAPLRSGERFQQVAMEAPYTPSAPTGVGTDDYRCFLLDPNLEESAYLTGSDVLPGNPDVVHHVILFKVTPENVERALEVDATTEGPGWTCFGGDGLEQMGRQVDDSGWLAGWAPGGGESVFAKGRGIKLEPGSRIVMQVHYNLIAGPDADISATRLRLAPGTQEMEEVSVKLMPVAVELPCRPGRDTGALCDRRAAVADGVARFGAEAGALADLLHLLCDTRVTPGPVQSCTRTMSEPTTVVGVAGHMHLLGKEITITLNQGTPRERTLLHIPVWDFDDQAAQPIKPVQVKKSDTITVSCRHTQKLRDVLPAFEGIEEKYVMWGEGTTDEMCLGILQVVEAQ